MRPRSRYHIGFFVRIKHFRPAGPVRATVLMLPEEAEALRLKHLKGFGQIEAAACMGISQSTFQRLLASAHRKMSEALITGKAIEIV